MPKAFPYALVHARWPTRQLARAVRAQRWDGALQALAHQANPDVEVTHRRTAQERSVRAPVLFWALHAGQHALVDALLQAGASVTHRLVNPPHSGAAHGPTVLDWVTHEVDLLALLRAGLGQFVPCGNTARDTSLHVAAEHGWVEAVRYVVERTGLVDVRNALGQTPLHAAVRIAHPPRDRVRIRRTIAYLLEQGAPLEACDAVGDTALATAATHAPHLVSVLLRAGANPAVLSSHQMQALGAELISAEAVSYLSPG